MVNLRDLQLKKIKFGHESNHLEIFDVCLRMEHLLQLREQNVPKWDHRFLQRGGEHGGEFWRLEI